jgi:hypothetical protein
MLLYNEYGCSPMLIRMNVRSEEITVRKTLYIRDTYSLTVAGVITFSESSLFNTVLTDVNKGS